MRTTTNVAWLAGPLVALGYLVGSMPVTFFLGRRRLRRQLSNLDHLTDVRQPSAESEPTLGRPGELAAAVVQGVLTLGVATLAWHVIVEVAPPATPSAVAVLSAQGITVWQSVALWTGLAAVVGQVAPFGQRFQGGTGVVPASALLLAYVPLVFSAAVAAVLALHLVRRDLERAAVAAFPAAVTFAWLAWVYDWRPGWGLAHGPEVSLWITVLAGVLFTAHRLRVDPGPGRDRPGPEPRNGPSSGPAQ